MLSPEQTRSPEQIRQALAPMNLRRVSVQSGVGYASLYRFFRGRTKKPPHDLILKLDKFLDAQRRP